MHKLAGWWQTIERLPMNKVLIGIGFLFSLASKAKGQDTLKIDCSVLKVLLSDVSVRTHLYLDTRVKLPVVLFDLYNHMPNCSEVTVFKNRKSVISHDENRYRHDTSIGTRIVIYIPDDSRKENTFDLVLDDGSSYVIGKFRKVKGRYVLYEKHMRIHEEG